MPPQLSPLPFSILEELKALPIYAERAASTLKTDYHMLVGLFNDVGPSNLVGATIEDDEFGLNYLFTLDRIRNYPAKIGKSWNYNTAKHRHNVYSRFILDVIWANVNYRRLYLKVTDRDVLESQLQHCMEGIQLDISDLRSAGEFNSLSTQLSSKWVSWSSWLAAGRSFVSAHKDSTDLSTLQAILMFYLFIQRCRRLELLSLGFSRGPQDNFVDLDDTTVILNKYKTAKKYFRYSFRMKAYVKKAYIRLKEEVSKYPSMRYIFGTPSAPTTIPSTLKMQQLNQLLCGVSLSVDNLRHMYYLHVNPSNKVLDTKLALEMGTSTDQLASVYKQAAPVVNCEDYNISGSTKLYQSRTYATSDQERIIGLTYNVLWGPEASSYVQSTQWANFITRFTDNVTNAEIRTHFGQLYLDKTKARKSMLHWARRWAKKTNVPYSVVE